MLVDTLGQVRTELEVGRFGVDAPSFVGRQFAIETLRLGVAGKDVLDVGCGSGIIGIAAAQSGANVTCTDIDQSCIDATNFNAKTNDVDVCIMRSDGFENISGTFDLIVANCPFPDMTMYNHVVEEASNYLNEGGNLITWICSAAEVKDAKRSLFKNWDAIERLSCIDYDFCRLGKATYTDAQREAMQQKGYLVHKAGRVVGRAEWFRAFRL